MLCCFKDHTMLTKHMIEALVHKADSIAAANPYEVLEALKELLGTNFEKKQGLEKDLAYARLIFNTELKEGDRINFKDNIYNISEINLAEDKVRLSRIDEVMYCSDIKFSEQVLFSLQAAAIKAAAAGKNLSIADKESIANEMLSKQVDIRSYRRDNYFPFKLKELVFAEIGVLEAEQTLVNPHKVETVS